MSQEIKSYILNCLDFLEISYKEVEKSIFEISSENSKENNLITFDKKNSKKALYITKESTFFKNISAAVADKKIPILTSTLNFPLEPIIDQYKKSFSNIHKITFKDPKRGRANYIFFWVKLSLKSFKNEEKIEIFKYDIENKKFSIFKHSSEELFKLLIDNEKNTRVVGKKEIENSLLLFAEKHSNKFIEEKNEEAKELLEEEVERINNYYDLLENEDSSGETFGQSGNKNDKKEHLLNERNNLIQQQILKYNFSSDDLTIEILECLHVNEIVEEIKLNIKSKYISKTFKIKSDEKFKFDSVNFTEENKLHLLSDGEVTVEKNACECSQCKKSYRLSTIKHCAICDKETCPNCASRSVISHAVLCKKHVETCTSCHKTVATTEMEECQSCGSTYCKWCLSGGYCSLCNDLY